MIFWDAGRRPAAQVRTTAPSATRTMFTLTSSGCWPAPGRRTPPFSTRRRRAFAVPRPRSRGIGSEPLTCGAGGGWFPRSQQPAPPARARAPVSTARGPSCAFCGTTVRDRAWGGRRRRRADVVGGPSPAVENERRRRRGCGPDADDRRRAPRRLSMHGCGGRHGIDLRAAAARRRSSGRRRFHHRRRRTKRVAPANRQQNEEPCASSGMCRPAPRPARRRSRARPTGGGNSPLFPRPTELADGLALKELRYGREFVSHDYLARFAPVAALPCRPLVPPFPASPHATARGLGRPI